MQSVFRNFLIALAVCLPMQAAWADKYDEAIEVFKGAGESGSYFETAHGFALFPTIGKGGIGLVPRLLLWPSRPACPLKQIPAAAPQLAPAAARKTPPPPRVVIARAWPFSPSPRAA